MKNMDEFLQHHGVKGMKWGVIKSKLSKGQNGNKAPKKPGRIKEELSSLKRERSWKKIAKNMDSLSTKDINALSRRAQMENDLKRLSKSSVGSSKDKTNYRRRDKMSDQELSRKITRLRAKDQLSRQAKEASKEQLAFGKKVVEVVGPYAVSYMTGGMVSPQKRRDKVLKEAGFTRVKRK